MKQPNRPITANEAWELGKKAKTRNERNMFFDMAGQIDAFNIEAELENKRRGCSRMQLEYTI